MREAVLDGRAAGGDDPVGGLLAGGELDGAGGLVAGDDDLVVAVLVEAEEAQVGQGAEAGGASDRYSPKPCSLIRCTTRPATTSSSRSMSLTSGIHCPRTPLRRFLDRELSAGATRCARTSAPTAQ
ncbi:hypothetical protein [Streptomyces sp. NPDC055140]